MLRLAVTNLLRLRWSAEVQEGWRRSLIAARPELTDKLGRTRELMEKAVPDAEVTGHQDLIPSLDLPDPDDRHVLAAAIIGCADVVVTLNLRDFPGSRRPLEIEAQHPVVFVRHVPDVDLLLVLTAAHREPPRQPALAPPTTWPCRGARAWSGPSRSCVGGTR